MKNPLGTLLRCPHFTEARLALYQKLGMNILQIAGVSEEYIAPTAEAEKKSDELFALIRQYGFSVPTMFLFFPNQDWSRIKETTGLVPEAFRAERMVLACRQMLWGKKYGIQYIACHVGCQPEAGAPEYEKFVNDLRQLALFAEANGQQFIFETGMESGAALKQLLDDLAPAKPGINFDPANLLIYDRDTPDHFLDLLEDRVRVVHCKDGKRPQDGNALGKETVLGQGDARFADVLKRLLKNGFAGNLVIERELPPGPEQERDIAEAIQFIQAEAAKVK